MHSSETLLLVPVCWLQGSSPSEETRWWKWEAPPPRRWGRPAEGAVGLPLEKKKNMTNVVVLWLDKPWLHLRSPSYLCSTAAPSPWRTSARSASGYRLAPGSPSAQEPLSATGRPPDGCRAGKRLQEGRETSRKSENNWLANHINVCKRLSFQEDLKKTNLDFVALTSTFVHKIRGNTVFGLKRTYFKN